MPDEVGAGVSVLAADSVVEEVAAAADVVEVGRSLTASLPQSLHVELPGVFMLHCLKVSWQMKLGRVSRYSAICGGSVPLVQVQT